MGMRVELTGVSEIAVSTAVRRGLNAGGALVLAASDAQAPREVEPRHGFHMTDVGFVRNEIGPEGQDQVAIGYAKEAYWALFVHENMHDHHPNGGVAKFLELAMLEFGEAAFGEIAGYVREALARE